MSYLRLLEPKDRLYSFFLSLCKRLRPYYAIFVRNMFTVHKGPMLMRHWNLPLPFIFQEIMDCIKAFKTIRGRPQLANYHGSRYHGNVVYCMVILVVSMSLTGNGRKLKLANTSVSRREILSCTKWLFIALTRKAFAKQWFSSEYFFSTNKTTMVRDILHLSQPAFDWNDY